MCKHVLVEKQEGRERDVLGRGSNLPVRRQMRQVLADFVDAHLLRVAFLMVENEATDNGDVSSFGTDAVMAQPEGGANFIEELGHEAKYST